MPDNESLTLSHEQAERATAVLETAAKRLEDTRQRMDEQQTKIQSTLERIAQLERANTDGGKELGELQKRLEGLSQSVEQLAEQNTNLLDMQRRNVALLSQSGADQDAVFTCRRDGAVFKSRRQAVELGYFFMATMKKEDHVREHARRWLHEQRQDLRYLPNIPPSILQMLGADHQQVVQRCLSQGVEYAAESLGGSTTPGSVLVFPEFADTLIDNVERFGVFRQEARIWPMGSSLVHIPRRTGGLVVYWEGEANTAQQTDPSFDLLKMIAKKAMAIHLFSSELAEDESAAIAYADIIMTEFARAVAYEEDRIGFLGDGAGGNAPGFAGFVGVLGCARQLPTADPEDLNQCLKVVGEAGEDRTDEVTLKSLHKMVGACHTWARPNAKWYMNRTVAQDIFGIETGAGNPVVSFARGRTVNVLGYPLREPEVLPISPGTADAPAFAFGDLRASWTLGDRRKPLVETSEHFKFDTDQVAVRLTARLAFLPHAPNGMVVYETAS